MVESGGRERPGGTVVGGGAAARRVAQGSACVTPNTCERRVRKSVSRRRCLPPRPLPPAAPGVLEALNSLTSRSRLGGNSHSLTRLLRLDIPLLHFHQVTVK